MKINELILEHPVDEGVGQAIGKAWGGLARGAGAVAGGLAGTWDAAKQGYAAGKSAVAGTPNPNASAPAGGTATPPAPGGTAPAGGGNAPAASGSTAPTQGNAPTELPAGGKGTGQNFDPQTGKPISQYGQQQQGETPPAPGGTTPPAPGGNAPAAEPAAPAGMKADEIVKGLSDVWGKARASQDSMTGAPAVQQQIRAMGKEAGMAGQTFENRKSKKSVVEFRSNFLGIVI